LLKLTVTFSIHTVFHYVTKKDNKYKLQLNGVLLTRLQENNSIVYIRTVALCHRLWGLNDFKDVIKQVPEDIIPSRPEESVWPNTMHTFHLDMRFICAKDDAWIQLLIISEHAPLPKQLWTSPLDSLHLLAVAQAQQLVPSAQN
jgi:hypothetical protein